MKELLLVIFIILFYLFYYLFLFYFILIVLFWLTSESGCIWPNAQSDRAPQSWSVWNKYVECIYSVNHSQSGCIHCYILCEFTCPVHNPTTKSAMKVSSVSPERWLTITPHPFFWAILHLWGEMFTQCFFNLQLI